VTSQAIAVKEIEWPVADDLIGDVGVTYFDVPGFGWRHRRTLCLNIRLCRWTPNVATEFSTCPEAIPHARQDGTQPGSED